MNMITKQQFPMLRSNTVRTISELMKERSISLPTNIKDPVLKLHFLLRDVVTPWRMEANDALLAAERTMPADAAYQYVIANMGPGFKGEDRSYLHERGTPRKCRSVAYCDSVDEVCEMLQRFVETHGHSEVYKRACAIVAEAKRRRALRDEHYGKCVAKQLPDEYERRANFFCDVEVALRRTSATTPEGLVVLMKYHRDWIEDNDLEEPEVVAMEGSIKNIFPTLYGRPSLQIAA